VLKQILTHIGFPGVGLADDDGDGVGDVGTTAGNTRFGGDHAQGS
jgi:hypothetical protein